MDDEIKYRHSTLFFRDKDPFWTLRDLVIPDLVKKRNGELKIWSAGCSTGQEAYSIAMIAKSHPALKNWKVDIYASDYVDSIVHQARAGIYNYSEVKEIPPDLLKRYFLAVGKRWIVRPELKIGIQFLVFNLSEKWPELPKMDVIFARNVLNQIAYRKTKEDRKSTVERIRLQLESDGYLFSGLGPLSEPELESFWDGFKLKFSERSCCFVRGK